MTASSAPASQPNRTSVATTKTYSSETPPASAPSTGTGKRSANIAAISKAPIPMRSTSSCAPRAKKNAALARVKVPAAHTGTNTASSRGGRPGRIVTALPLPAELAREVLEAAEECDGQECDHDQHCVELRSPLKHRTPSNWTMVNS